MAEVAYFQLVLTGPNMEGGALLEMFEQEEPTNNWIVTFADMMMLILVFFILIGIKMIPTYVEN